MVNHKQIPGHINTPLAVFAFLGVLLFGTAACSHETGIVDGPLLVDRFGDFFQVQPLTLDRTTVDFAAGEQVAFSAQFNKQVEWLIQITGTESGAVKRITSFGNELNSENASWDGGTTTLPFFKQERAIVELIIPEADSLTTTAEVDILSPKTYEGVLAVDFEAPAGDNIFFGNFEFELTGESGRSMEVPAAQGDWFYLLRGTDNVVPNFFAGLIDIQGSITGSTYFPVPTTVPEDLYFNMFLYSDGSPYTIAVVQLVFDSNDTGAFEDGQDEAIPFGDIPVDWEGWQHFYKPLSELGMTEAQVQKIVAIRVLLISDLNAQPDPPEQVDYGIDYLVFTAGNPLEL